MPPSFSRKLLLRPLFEGAPCEGDSPVRVARRKFLAGQSGKVFFPLAAAFPGSQFSMRKGRLCRTKNLGGVYLPPFHFRYLDRILQKGDFCIFAVEWEANAIRF